jgi:hypothetical protein
MLASHCTNRRLTGPLAGQPSLVGFALEPRASVPGLLLVGDNRLSTGTALDLILILSG